MHAPLPVWKLVILPLNLSYSGLVKTQAICSWRRGAPAGAAVAAGKASKMVAVKQTMSLNAKNLAKWLNAVMIPILFFVVTSHVIMLLSGLALVLANLILPLAAAFIML